MMKDVRELVTLYSYVGTHNPYWRLSEDCNILHFSIDEASEADQTIELLPEQADRIREMTVITSSLLMTLPIEDDDIPVHLVGRKINKREWAGSASARDDTPPSPAIWPTASLLPNKSFPKPIPLLSFLTAWATFSGLIACAKSTPASKNVKSLVKVYSHYL